MRILIALLIILTTSSAYCQGKNSEAIAHYLKAEELYNTGKYFDSYDELNICDSLLNGPNSKTLYLRIKGMNESYKQVKDSTWISWTLGFIDYFFSITDKSTYPKEKYEEILEIKSMFEKRKTTVGTDSKDFKELNKELGLLNVLVSEKKWTELFTAYEDFIDKFKDSRYAELRLAYCSELYNYLFTGNSSDISNSNLETLLRKQLEKCIKAGDNNTPGAHYISGLIEYNRMADAADKLRNSKKEQKELKTKIKLHANAAIEHFDQFINMVDKMNTAQRNTYKKLEYRNSMIILREIYGELGNKEKESLYQSLYETLKN